MSRSQNELFEAILRQAEGCSLTLYKEPISGKLHIGHGRNIEDIGITEEEAALMLRTDIRRAIDGVLTRWPWVASLPEARQAVLYEMAFNLGLGGLAEFSKMLRALANGDIRGTVTEMLDSQWARQLPLRVRRLAKQMETGRWAS